MTLQLYGLTSADTARAVAQDRALTRREIGSVEALGVAALVGPPAKLPFLQRGKVRELRRLLDFEQTLEAILPHGPLLAASPGACLRDARDALGFIAANITSLRGALNAYGDKLQFQVSIAWDPVAALAEARRRDDFGAIRRLAERDDRKALGRAIQSAMEAERAARGDRYAGMLAAAALDLIRLPLESADAVLNAAVMVDRAGEARLDRALEAIDASWAQALTIKCVGPLPALSFASVALERPDPNAIAAACARLGVDASAEPTRVRDAYHAIMKRVHPDVTALADNDAAAVEPPAIDPRGAIADYRFMMRISEAHAALRAFRPDAAQNAPVLAVMRREGDAGSAPMTEAA